jgi:1-deoxy-D-xylulose-5-phosphate reductoisomerase
MLRNITILGSTGSIGESTLEVVRANKERNRIIALTAGKNWKRLAEQALEFNPDFVAMATDEFEEELRNQLKHTKIKIGFGPEALIEAVSIAAVNTVVAAIVGFAGLEPVMAAIKLKRRICLANKETLVAAGGLFMKAIKTSGAELLPVDSEHSAIFQCLGSLRHNNLSKILLTASGGPFRDFTKEQLTEVTKSMALKHPNWDMGGKITIDSATLMNKGLEVIEAHWLFKVPFKDIEVVVHPESIIHSMVEYTDGSVIAQLGWPDMKLPIQYALSWPTRWEPTMETLDIFKIRQMTFAEPNYDAFPCLKLAINAGENGGTQPCILNAANEVAVNAFLADKISFVEIPQIIKDTLSIVDREEVSSIKQLIEVDALARNKAKEMVGEKNE